MNLPREAETIELFEARIGQPPYYEVLIRGRRAVHDGDYIERLTVTECGSQTLSYTTHYSEGYIQDTTYSGAYLVEWLTASETEE